MTPVSMGMGVFLMGFHARSLTLLALAAAGLGGCQRSEAENRSAGANAAAPVTAAAADPVARGRYLTTVMGCVDCHNTGSFGPHPEQGHLQGGTIGFEMPGMGIFYPPNLTPHPEAGIGRWSEAEIVTALRTGRRPDGRVLAPIMPWNNYRILDDADAAAIAAYLKSLPPSDHRVPGPGRIENAPQPYLTVHPPASGG
jgi:mono/diheme cytochrome c family protein